jgi:hypothetical protein
MLPLAAKQGCEAVVVWVVLGWWIVHVPDRKPFLLLVAFELCSSGTQHA